MLTNIVNVSDRFRRNQCTKIATSSNKQQQTATNSNKQQQTATNSNKQQQTATNSKLNFVAGSLQCTEISFLLFFT